MVSLSDDRLLEILENSHKTERAIRFHLSHVGANASEQLRGQVAYRHAVAIRKALEDWVETRAYRAAAHQE